MFINFHERSFMLLISPSKQKIVAILTHHAESDPYSHEIEYSKNKIQHLMIFVSY